MKYLFLILFVLISFYSLAQNPADVEKAYGEYQGFDDTVNSLLIQNDGKLIAGGRFTRYKGYESYRIIRINPDGSVDPEFTTGSGFNHAVNELAIQPDGKILVGGNFTSFNNLMHVRLIRLNSDGSTDTSFNVGVGFNDNVNSISVQNDGKIIVGGSFTNFQGNAENRLIRLNADGSKDTTFNIASGFDNRVDAILLQNDGKIIIGGSFTTFQGISQNRIIRLNSDGSKDVSFDVGNGFNGPIYTIVNQSNKLLIGGSYSTYKNNSQNNLIRLNNDGSIDTDLNIGTGFNGSVNAISIQNDGKIILGGNYTSFNNLNKNRLIRIDDNGSIDTSLDIGVGFSNAVTSIVIGDNNSFFLGGAFTLYKNVIERSLIKLNNNGTEDLSFNSGTGFSSSAATIAIQNDDKVIIGGFFSSYDNAYNGRIIRLNPDGSRDNSFITETGFNGFVYKVLLQDDGKILVGGDFTTYKGITQNRLIRLNPDGSKDSSFNIGVGFGNDVFTMAMQNDNKIIIGGDFITFNGVSQRGLIRLNPDGTKDSSFNIGTGFLGGAIYCLAIQSDGKIIVGGNFTEYNNIPRNRLIRLNPNGSVDTTFDLGNGFDQIIYEVIIQPDGKILVGGNFTNYQNITGNKIVRLNPNGTRDFSFDVGNGFNTSIYAIKLQNNGKILVGGSFVFFQNQNQNGLIRLNSDGTKDTSFDIDAGIINYSSGQIDDIALYSDGKILLCGAFYGFKNVYSSGLIRLYGDSTLSNNDFSNATTISLWPNPTKEILTLNSSDNDIITAVKIYDLQGKLVLESLENSINVSSLSPGMYLIKINTEKSEFTEKFIKD